MASHLRENDHHDRFELISNERQHLCLEKATVL